MQKGEYIDYHCTGISRVKGHPRARVREEALDEQSHIVLEGLQVQAEKVREWFVEVFRPGLRRARSGAARGAPGTSERTKVQSMTDEILDRSLRDKLSEDDCRRKEADLRGREWELG